MARTAAVAPVVDVLDAPVALRTPGGNDGVRRGTAERMARSKSLGASWNGDGVRLETTVTAARGSGEDVLVAPAIPGDGGGVDEEERDTARTMVTTARSFASWLGEEAWSEMRQRR